MKRRSFLKRALPVASLPYFMNGLSMKAFGKESLFEQMISASAANDNVLVLVQLNGGNDGLNTVIPLDQYSTLSQLRGNIMIPENLVLPINGSLQTGLHPSMTGLRNLFNSQKALIIQGVSYPNPSYSHFRATDIWLTGADSDENLPSGWVGRYLDAEYPGFPTGYPNADDPHPLALQIGNVASTALQGPAINMGIAITSSTNFYQLTSGIYDPAPSTPAGHELEFIRETSIQTQLYSTVIRDAALSQANLSAMYPTAGQNSLADQLKIVAQLIGGGLQTKIYMVNLGGFDTHDAQVSATGGVETGQHAELLRKVSEAIEAFQDDVTLMGQQDRVIGMTFSEFGRRIASNESLGTDHGSSLPVFLFGTKVSGGLLGENPQIAIDQEADGNLAMQFDFRSVYSSILQNWFCVPAETVTSVLHQDFPVLPLFTENCMVTSGASVNVAPASLRTWPNPSNGSATVEFSTIGGMVEIKVFDMLGKERQTITSKNYSQGIQRIDIETSDLPAGTYFLRMSEGGKYQTIKITVI